MDECELCGEEGHVERDCSYERCPNCENMEEDCECCPECGDRDCYFNCQCDECGAQVDDTERDLCDECEGERG